MAVIKHIRRKRSLADLRTKVRERHVSDDADVIEFEPTVHKKRDQPKNAASPSANSKTKDREKPSLKDVGRDETKSTVCKDVGPFAWPSPPVVHGRKDAAYMAVDPQDRVANLDLSPASVGANAALCEVVANDLLQVAYSEGLRAWRWLDTQRGIDAPYASLDALCEAYVQWWFQLYGPDLIKMGEVENITPSLRTEVTGTLAKALGVSSDFKTIKEVKVDPQTNEEVETTKTKSTRIGVATLHEDVASITLPTLVAHRASGTLHHNPIGGERRRKLKPITVWDSTFLDWLNGMLTNAFQYRGDPFKTVPDAVAWLRNTWRVNPKDPTAWGVMWLARTMHNFGERGAAMLWMYGGGGVGKSTILDWTAELMNPPQAQRVARKSNGEDLQKGWTDSAINSTTALMIFDDVKRHHYSGVLDTLKPALGGPTMATTTARHVGTTEVDLVASYAAATNSLPFLENDGNAWDRRITILESRDLNDHEREQVRDRVALLLEDKERLLDQLNWFYYVVGKDLDLSATHHAIPTAARSKAFGAAKSLSEELVLGDELDGFEK